VCLDEGLLAQGARSTLAAKYAELVRKIWHGRNFKSHTSPHEVLQLVSSASRKRFRPGVPVEPIAFFVWFANHLSRSIKLPKSCAKKLLRSLPDRGMEKAPRSPIDLLFKGEVTTKLHALEGGDAAVRGRWETLEVVTSPFVFLSLDVPNPALYPSDRAEELALQVPLSDLLAKYDGRTPHNIGKKKKTYVLAHNGIPPYLVFHLDRDDASSSSSPNATVVNFPRTHLDMAPYMAPSPDPTSSSSDPTTYSLLAAVLIDTESSQDTEPSYSVALASPSEPDVFYRIQDLAVDEIPGTFLSVSNAVLLIYARDRLVVSS